MKNTLALVLPCLVACAALSCSGTSSNPSHVGADASAPGKDGGAGSATPDGSNTVPVPDAQAIEAPSPDVQAIDAPSPDVQTIDAPGPEATVPVDAGVDRATGGGSDVGASDTGSAPDRAIVDSPAPQPVPDGSGDLGDDGGGDAGTRDANATEARTPDASPSDASTPDAKADKSAADVMVVDATADSLPPKLDAGPAQCGRIKCDCTYNGTKLWGNVQFVSNFPDFKVKISSFPDLNVEESYFPLQCGQWHTVTAFPDFTVQIVDMFEDFDIAYSAFPGIP